MQKPPYQSSNGMWYTDCLFYERWAALPLERRPSDPVFSLYRDKPGMINARLTFIDCRDPTGYKWAIKYLGDWQHWLRLYKTKWFQEAVQAWNDELAVQLKSEAVSKIMDIAGNDTAQSLQAAKYLIDKGWVEKKSGRGRPSNEEVAAELKTQAREQASIDEDAERIGLFPKLVVIK